MVGTHPSSFMIAPPVQDACSAPTARRSVLRRPTPPRLQSVDRLDRARCFSLNDVHSRRDHERAQGRRPANIKAMAATGRNGVSNADERTRRARSARPSADKCITFRINGRSADELRLAQVRMPTGAGAMMILQVHLPRDGPAHGRVGHPILRCVRQTPRVRWIAHRACSLGGRHISKRLRDSKQKSRFGQRGDSRFRVPSHERGCRRRQGTDCAQLVVRGVVDAGSCPLN